MSNPEADKKRVNDLTRAVVHGHLDAVKGLGRADVEILVRRIEELELDETACASEFVPWAVKRMREDLAQKRDWLVDAIEQVRIAELCVMEAQHALIALEKLAAGDLFVSGDEIIKRWDAFEADCIARGVLAAPPADPPSAEAQEPPPAPMTPPEPEPPPLPPELVAQLSKPARRALAPPTPSPAKKPAPPKPPPAPVSDLGPRILAALDWLIDKHGQDLNAMRVAEHLEEPHERVRVALGDLERAGLLQMIRRADKNMYAILRPGESLTTSDLTDNQTKLLTALTSVAGADWKASISRGRLKTMTGINAGSLDQILWALEKKDCIRILDRGNATTPTSFLICEGHRPARASVPKTDAELIAEALAAGRITKVPGPEVVH